MKNILVIDDEELNYKSNKSLIESLPTFKNNCSIHWAATIPLALDLLQKHPFEVVLLDVHLKDQRGPESIPQLLSLNPLLEIIVLSGSQDSKDIIDALRRGAMTYMTRPVRDRDLLEVYLNAALEKRTLKISAQAAQNQRDGDRLQGTLIGSSPTIQNVRAQLSALGRVQSTVLFYGASGCGKGLAATCLNEIRRQHYNQPTRPFMNLNIAGISDTLAEAELFGYERGAFTDAKNRQPGFFELADGGDIFLDEIGDASLSMQAKLLKVIQEKTFYRIGGRIPISSNFSLICATNKDLKDLVSKGLFREDLFMRISTFTIQLPDLKERREDIPDLIYEIAPRIAKRLKIDYKQSLLTPRIIQALQNHHFQGNVRELEAVLERLFVYGSIHKSLERALEIAGLDPNVTDITPDTPRVYSESTPISMLELRERSLNLIHSPTFISYDDACRVFEQKLISEARKKYSTQNEMAQALGLSKSAISIKLKSME